MFKARVGGASTSKFNALTLNTGSAGKKSPAGEASPRSPRTQADDGWETVPARKGKASGQPTMTPYDRKLNEVQRDIADRLAGRGQPYSTVNASRADLPQLHADLRARYHGQPIAELAPQNGGRWHYYVTQQQGSKGGGFNVTAHLIGQNGRDLSKERGITAPINIHVVP